MRRPAGLSDGDKPDNRLEIRSNTRLPPAQRFRRFADHDDGFSCRIGREQRQRVDEARADQRVAANPDARRLSRPSLVS
jgi:hypothetical protein